jgi:signal transduction histidine kinase
VNLLAQPGKLRKVATKNPRMQSYPSVASSSEIHRPATRDFLAGGGQMGALTRSMNWSATPVGAVEVWPESLKTSVAICLRSKFPMVIWWGREHLTQFYNDAYISFLGKTKHPRALGQSARECWKELWHIIDPMLEGVFQTGEATWSEDLLFFIDRALPREEGYFTFSYSGIPQLDQTLGGIFCACVETTDRVIGERQLTLLRELAARTAEARAWQQACRLSADVLATDRNDLPFTLIYIVDGETQTISLPATSGVSREIILPPGGVTLRDWPFAEVLRGNAPYVISNLQGLLTEVPKGPWPQVSTQAVALPILPSGTTGKAGVLIVGLNPCRPLDDKYRRFLTLVAAQVSASIADAYSYEQESKRVQALAEIDRAKTVFFSNVSHEFRTPLTLILGTTEAALDSPDRALRSAELKILYRNELRLLKLVNNLLDFSRIEAGRVEAIYEPTDIAAFTAGLASSFRFAMQRAGLDFEVDCQPISDPVFVDHDMWEKIVLNLISNAFKFTFEGKVTVSIQSLDGRIEFAVRDTGTGIPAGELPHIFERFHRAANARGRSYEGTGIGLALVQELAKLHGGGVKVESQEGGGSCFTVSIPKGKNHLPQDRIGAARSLASSALRARSYAEEALQWLPHDAAPGKGDLIDVKPDPTAVTVSALADEIASANSKLIVVADDNADMRAYLCRLLGDQYRVEAVSNGADALNAARDLNADLILSDVMMPSLDGFGLLQALRADPATRLKPVIFLSARAGEESRIEGLKAGADDYLVKPFTARELLARVGAHLKLAQVRCEAAEMERRLRTEVELARAQLEKRVNERTTELQLANQELRQLSSRLQQTQDEERRRLARELHDSAGQLLIAIAMNIALMKSEVQKLGPEAAKRVEDNAAMVDQLITEIRTISHLLHPPLLDEVGLASALRWYVEGFAERGQIAASLDLPEHLERFSAEMEIAIFRVVQECLTNVHRHSGSRSCSVKVVKNEDDLQVEIRDEGRGIPTEKRLTLTASRGGVGLRGMRERIGELGGTLRINSSQQGTSVVVNLPIPKISSPPQDSAA